MGNAKTLMQGDLYGGWKSLLRHLYHQNSLLKVFKMDSGDLKYSWCYLPNLDSGTCVVATASGCEAARVSQEATRPVMDGFMINE